jgi:hypothetical protein
MTPSARRRRPARQGRTSKSSRPLARCQRPNTVLPAASQPAARESFTDTRDRLPGACHKEALSLHPKVVRAAECLPRLCRLGSSPCSAEGPGWLTTRISNSETGHYLQWQYRFFPKGCRTSNVPI